MKLSVVIPMMNEQENVIPLFNAIRNSLKDIGYELILVDDGSTDQTISLMQKKSDNRTTILVFNRYYGQSSAMAAGIDQAQGELIVTLDGDLQNDPSDIPMMIDVLEKEGFDVVAGRRANRQDGMVLRKIPSKIANALIRKSTGVHLRDYGCTLKVFKKEVAKNLGLYGELHRFIPVLAKLYGAKIKEVDVKHHARIHGVSKYGIGRTTRVFSDLMLMVFFQKYNVKPMHLFGTIGSLSLILGFFIEFYLLILKVLGEDIGSRPLFMVGILLIISGVMLITTGFLSEIMMRNYYESQGKKPYVVQKIIQSK